MHALEVESLTKQYEKGPLALNNLSFTLDEGEIFGLLGPNGSGKTTLISIITTLIEASSGEVKVFGSKVARSNLLTKRLLGVVPQEIVSHGFFTVNEILNFLSGYYGISNNQEHIDYLLHNMGLYPHRNKKVSQLSGGMKRRLLICKALVHKPKLLLLDEPTAGVDIELRNSLWDFVRELNRNGCTILLTTHYLEEAECLCDRVGIINHGELLRLGKTRDIIKDFTEKEFELELANEKVDMTKNPYFLRKEGVINYFRVPSNMDFGGFLSNVQIDIKDIKDFKVREGKLEDAFLRVLGDGNHE
tara:strand:- start:646 stop:1554 length:909 start_codon:yes stop_codon:yes gene_type:complete